MENGIVFEDKNKPVLDEQTLAKLLEAAYVLQEHNRELRELELGLELKRHQAEAEGRAASAAKKTPKTSSESALETAPPANYGIALAQIVETQHHIQIRHLELESAMTLVTERVVGIARASGAAIGIADGKNVHYRAVAGLKTLPKGASVSLDKSLCLPCFKSGQVFRCGDISSEFLLDTEECRRRGIESMIAVPVFHDGTAVGGLEVYYSAQNGFTEQDVHTCQLMAGLITEALIQAEELNWKKSLATERAAMLDALEKLKPNLAALIDRHPAKSKSTPDLAASAPMAQTCGKCGHRIVGEEQFCGQCGSPRSSGYEPPSMQSKVASLWQMQEARRRASPGESPKSEHAFEESQVELDELLPESPAPSIEAQVRKLLAASEIPSSAGDESATEPPELLSPDLGAGGANQLEAPPEAGEEIGTADPVALSKPDHRADWSSAASAREFLEQLASANRSSSLVQLWNTRRGDIYLAIAVILVACVIRWGIWSSHSVSATAAPNVAAGAHRKPPEPDLSLFDRMLIQLGLAEPPDSPEDKGNPSAQVWVDTRTALYYCPGTELYGKTPKGKFTTQREAQLDQFQPAYRKACN